MNAVTMIDSGTVATAIKASNGEIHSIITRMPRTVITDMTNWLSVCCKLCATLSMSLVTRERTSPRAWVSKYRKGSR